MLKTIDINQNRTFQWLGLAIAVPFIFVVCYLAYFSNTDPMEKFTLVLWSAGLGAAAVFVFVKTSSDIALNRTLTLIAGYFVFAYPFKAVLSQSSLGPEQELHFRVPELLFSKALMPAVAYTSGAIFGLLLLFFLFRRLKQTRFNGLYRPRYGLLFTVILVSLALKFVTQHYLIWGVPNQPTRNGIPLVTGAIVMYCKLGIFHLIALGITTAIIYRARIEQITALGLLAAIFLALDFSVGSKYSLVYLMVTAIFSVALMKSQISILQARVILLCTGCVIILSLYPVIHNYRFARKSSPQSDVSTLIQRSIQMTAERAENNVMIDSVLQVAKRINGFQNHAAAVQFSNTLQVGWKDLVSSAEASHNYTKAVTGLDHESNTYGITQCGITTMMFRNSTTTIFIFGFLLNLIVTGIVVFCSFKATKIQANWYAAGISNGLFLVFLQFQGGNLGFAAKQYVTILLTIWASKFFFAKRRLIRNPNEVWRDQSEPISDTPTAGMYGNGQI